MQPDAAGSAAEEMEVLAEEPPDLAMVACEQRFQRNALRVQHARDVVVGNDEEFGGCAEGCVRVGEETRVNVTVRREDGKYSRRFDIGHARYRAWQGREKENDRDSY